MIPRVKEQKYSRRLHVSGDSREHARWQPLLTSSVPPPHLHSLLDEYLRLHERPVPVLHLLLDVVPVVREGQPRPPQPVEQLGLVERDQGAVGAQGGSLVLDPFFFEK